MNSQDHPSRYTDREFFIKVTIIVIVYSLICFSIGLFTAKYIYKDSEIPKKQSYDNELSLLR